MQRVRSVSLRVHGGDKIALHYAIKDVEAGDETSEHRVMAIEVRLRRVGQEILAAAGVGTRESHPEGSPLVPMAVHLISNRVTGTAVAVIARIAVLNDEIGNHPMEARVPVVAGSGEGEKIIDGDGCFSAEELEMEIAFYRVDGSVRRLAAVHGKQHRSNDGFIPADGPRRLDDRGPLNERRNAFGGGTLD